MATFIEGVTDILPEPKMFTPDFSFIDKMLKRKDAMYEEGFARLNNQYNLINRELTNPANAAMRDQFLRQAKMNLKDLSTLDLSDPVNVNAAGDVFKPFYSNVNILGDQNLTQHWNQQLAIGNSFRLKDGGKEFSQDNLDYISKQKMAFAADDPSSVSSYAAVKRYYTPYYDYNKEIKDAMKDFKPNHTKIDKLDGMYVKTVEDQSWNALDISRYLNSVLSDKAKQQMRIESAVRIGDSPTSVAQAYMQTEGAEIPKLNSLIDKIDQSIKVEKDPQKLQALQKYKDYYEDQRREIGNNLKTIRSGDVDFLKRNGESIGYKAYYNSLVQKIANGYSHTDIEQSIKGDDVAMMYFREDQQWKRTYYEQSKADERQARADERADRRELLKAQKDMSLPEPVELAGTDLELYRNQLQADFKKADDGRKTAYANLISRIGKDLGKASYDVTEAEFYTWVNNKDNQNTTVYKSYMGAHSAYQIQKQAIEINRQSESDYLKSQLGDNNYNLYISISKIMNEINNLPPTQRAMADPYLQAARALNISVQDVKNIMSSVDANRKQYRSKMDEGVTMNVTGYTLLANDPRYAKAQQYIEGLTGLKEAKGVRFFPGGGTDASQFALSFNVDKEDDAKDIIARVLASGRGRDAKYNSDTKTLMVFGASENLAKQLDPYFGISQIHRKALRNIEMFSGVTDAGISTPPLQLPDYSGQQHQVFISKSIYYGYDLYNLKIDGKSVNYDFTNTADAYNAANLILQDANKLNSLK